MILEEILKSGYKQANRLSGGILSIVVRAGQSFHEARAAEAAAGIAYYALFSLFPLLIIVISLGSFVLDSEQARQLVLDFVAENLPTAQELVRNNMNRVIQLRGLAGIVAAIGLSWAATAVLSILAKNINLAWHTAERRSFLISRLVALGMVGGLVILVIFSALTTSLLFSLVAQFKAPLWGNVAIYETFIWHLASRLVPSLLMFMMFFSLYRWVPKTKVSWQEAGWGALVAIVGWDLSKAGFTWYLSSGLARYQLIYGSLGTVVVLMLWIYVGSLIILFGAHLSAAIGRTTKSDHPSP